MCNKNDSLKYAIEKAWWSSSVRQCSAILRRLVTLLPHSHHRWRPRWAILACHRTFLQNERQMDHQLFDCSSYEILCNNGIFKLGVVSNCTLFNIFRYPNINHWSMNVIIEKYLHLRIFVSGGFQSICALSPATLSWNTNDTRKD